MNFIKRVFTSCARWGVAVIVMVQGLVAALLSLVQINRRPRQLRRSDAARQRRAAYRHRPADRGPEPRSESPELRWAEKLLALPRSWRSAELPAGWRSWWTPALVTLVALVGSVLSVAHISVNPAGIGLSPSGPATARASLVVDTPDSILADLRQSTESFQTLDDRSAVLGRVIASPSVRKHVATQLKVPVREVEITPPGMGPAGSGAPYQMTIDVNAEVPMLDLQAQAPTARTATAFADAAIAGLRGYMVGLAAKQDIHAAARLRLTQIGSAVPDYAQPGANWKRAGIVFLVLLAAAYGGLVRLARARTGPARAVGAAF